ncbi:dockerin domain-containing protein [Desulfonema limicola]|uniref:Dockerin domain-containing protein n=1 Tax=Desulfonema limicola TaxID=45656 RepID=A0A975BE28_9BACT|nr:hypothetical protein [Desulfonema limicola]QTA83687.1 dockerin domain-containing protein [Desulfonema limicola]
MRGTVCELETPPIKNMILDNFIPWFCDVYGETASEYYPYASGLGGFTMPMICCIDPNDIDNYLDRTTNIQYPDEFYARLQGIVSSSVLAGDVDNKDGVNLMDSILSLQAVSGIPLTGVYTQADVNGDNRIGIEEAVFSLKYAASGSGGYTQTGQ